MSFSLLMSFHFILPRTPNILLSRILLPILKVPSYITTLLPYFSSSPTLPLFSACFKKILSSLLLFSYLCFSHLNPFLLPFIHLFSSVLIIPFSFSPQVALIKSTGGRLVGSKVHLMESEGEYVRVSTYVNYS